MSTGVVEINETAPAVEAVPSVITARVIYREDAKRTEELLIWLLQLSRSGVEL